MTIKFYCDKILEEKTEKRNEMDERFNRTGYLLGEEGLIKLNNSRVIVFGLGGVGGYAVEALARAGVGEIGLVDNDVVSVTNINRQIIATEDTVGKAKTELFAGRVKKINPTCKVNEYNMFYLPETADKIDLSYYDYVVDAIDTVSAKIALAENSFKAGVKIISSMGTGNKLDPTAFKVADISETKVCPLAKVIRRELKKRGIKGLKTVYSEEEPVISCIGETENKKRIPASISFVPPVCGMIMAGEVIKDIAGINDDKK